MPDQTLQRVTDKFVETEIDDEVVLMHLDTGQFFALKSTGRTIWQLIDGARNKADIQAALMEQFDVDEASCAAELDRFLADMCKAEFILAS
jgi:pyrroloquinoline quinone biosynthesis protein D